MARLCSLSLILCAALTLAHAHDEGDLGGLVLRALTSAISLAGQPPTVQQMSSRRFARAVGGARQGRSGTAKISWSSCGSRKDPMQLQRFELSPNPVRVPGRLRADMALLVREPISAPIKVSVQVQKEVELPLGLGSTWLELPCPGDSCSVRDACASNLLPREGTRCPAPPAPDQSPDNTTLGWRECSCPIPKGLYAMPPLEFNVSSPSQLVPDYLLNGGFYVKIRLSRHKRRLACVETTLDLDL